MDGGLTSYGIPRGISSMKEYIGCWVKSSGVSPYADGTEHPPFYHWAALVCAIVRRVDRSSGCGIESPLWLLWKLTALLGLFERDGPSPYGVLHRACCPVAEKAPRVKEVCQESTEGTSPVSSGEINQPRRQLHQHKRRLFDAENRF